MAYKELDLHAIRRARGPGERGHGNESPPFCDSMGVAFVGLLALVFLLVVREGIPSIEVCVRGGMDRKHVFVCRIMSVHLCAAGAEIRVCT